MPRSSYRAGDYLYSSRRSLEQRDAYYDFVTFLAVAQICQVQFLPLRWQAMRDSIGRGGTSDIVQALMSSQTSLAFKRSHQYQTRDEARIFRALTQEVMLLCHPSVRNHAYVAELQGICWDIPSDGFNDHNAPPDYYYGGKIWPVLVFEKSHHGDLRRYAASPMGRELSFNMRVKLCTHIGAALATMHENGIVHGDIKPENILIFGDIDHGLTAKVHDLGYSVIFRNEQEIMQLPKSEGWHAPEYLESSVQPSQARQMDSFSYGLLCFWLLFEPYISKIKEIPSGSEWARPCLNHGNLEDILGALRARADDGRQCPCSTSTHVDTTDSRDHLIRLARQLLIAEIEPRDDSFGNLFAFFESLAVDPSSRATNMNKLVHLLNPSFEYPAPLSIEQEDIHIKNFDFRVSDALPTLYSTDFRLRQYIKHCLEDRLRKSDKATDQNLVLQLALCFQLGFGCTRDEAKSSRLLQQHNIDQRQLDNLLSKSPRETRTGTVYESLRARGHHVQDSRAFYYQQHGILKTAERILRQERIDILEAFKVESSISVNLLQAIGSVVSAQGRYLVATAIRELILITCKTLWKPDDASVMVYVENYIDSLQSLGRYKDVTNFAEPLLKVKKEVFGLEHCSTLDSMEQLASNYEDLNRWEDARWLVLTVLRIRRKTQGEEHPDTMSTEARLAVAHSEERDYTKAEELAVMIKERREKILGAEHPDTLSSKGAIAAIYESQGRIAEAANLRQSVLESRRRILGNEHPSTLNSMANIAKALNRRDNLIEAEELGKTVLELRTRFLGPKHPDTLISLSNLVTTYIRAKRWDEAETECQKLVQQRSESLGPESRYTLLSVAKRASISGFRGRWTETEGDFEYVMKTRSKILGHDHPETLNGMDNLARTWHKLGRHQEAIELMSSCLDLRMKRLGTDHMQTQRTEKDLSRWREQLL